MCFRRIGKKSNIIALLLLCVIGQGFAQFEITKFTLNSGGGVSESAGFKISASIGQVDASVKSIGGGLSITGGFWHEAKKDDDMFTDGFE